MSIGPYGNQPSPTPSLGGLTVPVQAPTTSTTAPPISNTPDPMFVGWMNTILQGRLGPLKYSELSAADKTALIDKVWQDPTIQQNFLNNYANLAANNLSAVGNMLNIVSSVMNGQGNDPTTAVDYYNLIQASGLALTTAEQANLSTATQAVNAPIPSPFAAVAPSGYTFGTPMPKGGWSPKAPGDSFGWTQHWGTDYGTPAGERIVSPFAGTVTNVLGPAAGGYGNYVTVTLDNGYKIGFGHVANAEATTGSRVNPGDLIAISGANVGDSVGAVTIVTWQDPHGVYLNPAELLDPIFKGTTFSTIPLGNGQIGIPGAAGTGMSTVNTKLDTMYPSIKSDFVKYFGTPPSPEDVYNIVSHGNDPQQWTDYIRAMTSHISGLNMGQAYDLRSMADNVSMTALGHNSTDGVVKDLFDQGLTGQSSIQLWYNEHSPNEIDKETYNAMYKANKPTMDGIFNEKNGFDPRIAKLQHEQAKQTSNPQGKFQ